MIKRDLKVGDIVVCPDLNKSKGLVIEIIGVIVTLFWIKEGHSTPYHNLSVKRNCTLISEYSKNLKK